MARLAHHHCARGVIDGCSQATEMVARQIDQRKITAHRSTELSTSAIGIHRRWRQSVGGIQRRREGILGKRSPGIVGVPVKAQFGGSLHPARTRVRLQSSSETKFMRAGQKFPVAALFR